MKKMHHGAVLLMGTLIAVPVTLGEQGSSHPAVEINGSFAVSPDGVFRVTAPDEAAGPGRPVFNPPSQPAQPLPQLLDALDAPDPVRRESAIRQLTSRPAEAAGPLVSVLEQGTLARRLSALDILQTWGAPVDGVDPWEPQTLNADALARLRQWAADSAAQLQSTAVELTDDNLPAVRRQIQRMLQAGTDAEAMAAREQLVRYGPALLPEVTRLAHEAATDAQRQRLTALRYRLVASDALVMSWPGGIDRLAATDIRQRHQAVEELRGRARASEQALLLEMFGDPDPLVRELSLSMLRQVAGAGATDALVKLLNDPEPNVRAAVLKELAESPSERMLEPMLEYIQQERDADLLVHAARVLRQAYQEPALVALIGLLEHDSWRVRAEAAEALQGIPRGLRNTQAARDANAALVKLLDDPDGFVVSRALAALQSGADLSEHLDQLLEAAERHPDLAPEIVGIVARLRIAPERLAAMADHPNPAVRARVASATLSTQGLTDEQNALRFIDDAEPKVRTAAMAALLQQRAAARPRGDDRVVHRGAFIGSGPVVQQESPQQQQEGWLQQQRAGDDLPDWLKTAADRLVQRLEAADNDELIATALFLVSIGRDEPAVPKLLELARGDTEQVAAISDVLPWLPADQRFDVFDALLPLVPEDGLHQLARNLATMRHSRSPARLWRLLEQPELPGYFASTVHRALLVQYTGNEWFFGGMDLTEEQRKIISADVQAFTGVGPAHRQLLALSMLVAVDRSAAGEQALALADNADMAPEHRMDALRIHFASLPTPEANALAVRLLHHEDPQRQRLAIGFLASGGEAVHYILDRSVNVSHEHPSPLNNWTHDRTGRRADLSPPAGIEPEQVMHLLESEDRRLAAHAAYILALLKDARGLPLLREMSLSGDGGHWRAYYYRAIAAQEDDELTPLLEELYEKLKDEPWEAGNFYWTIRGIDGEQALLLRRRIREEIGMDRLR